MKNLIIIGIPRAGKTTLAKCVAQEIGKNGYPVSVVSADAILGGLTQIRKKSFFYTAVVRPCKHILPFISTAYKIKLMSDLYKFVPRFLSEQSEVLTVIYEDPYLSIDTAKQIFNKKKFKIVAIGYPNADIDKKIADIRKFDSNTPANRKNDEKLHIFVQTMINNSRNLAAKAKKHKILFIDTSNNYNAEIKKFAKSATQFLCDAEAN